MDQLPLENFENSRIELLVCQCFWFVKKTLIVSFVKSWSLEGRMVDYGKRGSVGDLRHPKVLKNRI
jgi:hypothetical protein